MSHREASLSIGWIAWITVGVLLTVVAAMEPSIATAGIAEKDENKKECKAKDENKDGEIGPGETQDCGGEVYGIGGDDGANLPPADDANSHQSVYNGTAVHWSKPSNAERKVIIRDSVLDSSSYNTKLGQVISDWGTSSKFKFVRQNAETDSTTRLNCPFPDFYGRVRVCNHDSYTFSWAGLANVRYNDQGHIQKARVRVKNSVADSARRPLLCQEVGHTLGLAHRATTGSCMHQNASAAAASPDPHDYEQLVDQTHSHGSESETGGALSDLDTGGGVLDGCTSFVCTDVSSHGHAEGWFVISVRHLRTGGAILTYGLSSNELLSLWRHKPLV